MQAAARRLEVNPPPSVDLTVQLNQAPAQQVRTLQAALREALEAQRPVGDASREGRVWCLRCESADCAHALPPTPTSVFEGWAPTGWPRWAELAQVCLARRLPGLERLFDDPPAVLGYVDEETALVGDVLAEYAGPLARWRPLGQAVVGPLLLPGSSERCALSVQVVALGQRGAPPMLRLNLLGMSGEAITDAATGGPPRGTAEGLRRTIQQARRQVGRLGRRLATAAARGEVFDQAEAVGSLLGRIRSDLQRIFEPRHWRTQHADDRHQDGARPTDMALPDAREAGNDRLYLDTRRETVIVIGPRGRAHVFSPAGRHVTSLRLEPGELARRTSRRWWSPLAPAAAEAFRAAVHGS